MRIIKNDLELVALCQQLSNNKVIYIDTEFDRQRTYYAILCTIQISDGAESYLIDTIAIDDLSPFKVLLMDKNLTKVLHSPQQDIEIFFHLFGKIPTNIFDTQIAADICGIAEHPSYGNLCKALLGENIDKSQRLSNWLARPLSSQQIDYALMDVKHLPTLYRHLSKMMDQLGYESKYQQKSARLTDKNTYLFDAENWVAKKNFIFKNHQMRRNFIALVDLREDMAKTHNKPRGAICKDPDLLNIAKLLPQTRKQLEPLNIYNILTNKDKLRERLLDLCSALASK